MAVERTDTHRCLVEILDRVLDKGIIIDAWFRVALMGLDLVTIQSRVVVASIQTYLGSSQAVALTGLASPIGAWANPARRTNGLLGQGKKTLKRDGDSGAPCC